MQFFTHQHKQLLTQYSGQSIAMLNGQVIDHDVDESALSQRVRSIHGNTPVLITPVLPQLIQTIIVQSPRIQTDPLNHEVPVTLAWLSRYRYLHRLHEFLR